MGRATWPTRRATTRSRSKACPPTPASRSSCCGGRRTVPGVAWRARSTPTSRCRVRRRCRRARRNPDRAPPACVPWRDVAGGAATAIRDIFRATGGGPRRCPSGSVKELSFEFRIEDHLPESTREQPNLPRRKQVLQKIAFLIDDRPHAVARVAHMLGGVLDAEV